MAPIIDVDRSGTAFVVHFLTRNARGEILVTITVKVAHGKSLTHQIVGLRHVIGTRFVLIPEIGFEFGLTAYAGLGKAKACQCQSVEDV